MSDEEIKVKLTADTGDAAAEFTEVGDAIAASNKKVTDSAAESAAAIKAQAANMEEVMTLRNGELISLSDYLAAGRESTAATVENTEAVAANAAAHAGLNEKIAAGSVVREYSALVDEALSGNYRRMTGTVAVLSNRLGLMSSIMSPLGAIAGAAAAGVGLFIAAIVKGAEESEAFNRALLETNGYIGISEDDFRDLAQQLSSSVNTVGEAKEALLAVASTGRYTGDQVRYISQAVLDFVEVTGSKMPKAIEVFNSLQEHPLEAAVKLNEQYHFLTEATYQQIAALETQGDIQGAAAVAQEALAGAMHDAAAKQQQDLGLLARGWNDVKDAFSGYWNGLKESFGGTTTITDQLRDVNRQIVEWKRRGAVEDSNVLQTLYSERDALEILLKNQEAQVDAQAKLTKEAQDYIDVMQGTDKSFHSNIEKTPPSASMAPKPELMREAPSNAALNRQLADNNELIKNEMSTASTMEKIDAERQQASITAEENALKQKEALGEITKTQELQGLMDLENKKFAMESAAMDQQASLYEKDSQKYNEYLLKKDKLAQEHEATMTSLADQEAREVQRRWQAAMAPMEAAVNQSVRGIVQGTETGRQAMANLGMSIVDEFIADGVKMVADWIAKEAAKTAATTSAESSRAAIKASAAVQDRTTTVTTAVADVASYAAVAAAAAASSVAEIPIVGWAMAPGVAAETYATTMGYAGLASAAGGWENVPTTSLAMLHKNEMVLPAKTAQTVRDAVSGGGSGAKMGDVHFHAVDAAGIRDMLRRNPRLISEAMQHAARNFQTG